MGHIGLAARHHRHPRTGEGDLAGGCELIDHVAVSGLPAQAQNIREGDELPLQLMDTVGIVPHQHEVRGGGPHSRQTLHRLRRINDALGIGVLGNVPHSLHRRIPHQPLHHVHVRPLLRHGYGDQLHAEGLADAEVAVIARCRAEPLHRLQLAPRLLAVEHPMGIRLGDGVVHQLQAGVAADEHLLRPAAQYLGKQRPCLRDARQLAIVPGIQPTRQIVLRSGQLCHLPCHHVQLLRAGLTTGHVQLQAQCLLCLIGLSHGGVFLPPLVGGHIRISFHILAPFRKVYSLTAPRTDPSSGPTGWAADGG